MIEFNRHFTNLPAEQQAIRDKCFHPTGNFVEFKKEEIEQSIPERFEKIVRMYPDRIAVKIQNDPVTYDALNKAANRVARLILDRLGSQNRPIVISSDQSLTAIILSLAIWKSGKILIAVESSFHAERIASTVKATQAEATLTSSDSLQLVTASANIDRQVINIDSLQNNFSDEDIGLQILAETPAEIRYSSGSTGQPKGIVRSHRRLLSSARSTINTVHICPDDRLLVLMDLSFGSRGILKGLLSGSGLFPFDIKKDGISKLIQLLIREKITCYHSVPSTFRYLVDNLEGTERFPSMRLIQLGGELLCRHEVESYKKMFSPECILMNRLSAGETGNLCQFFIDKDTEIDTPIVPVGYPTEGKNIFLLNDTGEEVGSNEAGEIAVRSRNLSSGYWNNSALTKAKFRTNPTEADQKVYLTGDLGKILPDGRILYLGRKDNQVKVRGIKVELTEVEATLLGHEAIADAVVVPRQYEDSEEKLVAYLILRKDKRATVDKLRHFLRQTLPEYLIPSAFVILDSLPRTLTGKVDRHALPDPDNSRPELGTPYVPPRTRLETRLVEIWTVVLKLHKVGIRDNFFDLGGHSLLAASLTSQIEKAFGRNLPLATFYQAPTIEQMASVLSGQGPSAPWSLMVSLQPYGSKPPFLCHGASLEMALHVGADQPFYGLQPHGQDGRQAPSTVEEMAADYIKQIRTVQREGPYFLGGYSFGGIVAFEMAQQLLKQGQQVALLVLLDAGGPVNAGSSTHRASSSLNDTSFRHKIYRHLHDFARRQDGEKFTHVLGSVKWRLEELRKKYKLLVCRLHLAIGRRIPEPLRMFYFFEISHQVRQKYVPQIYPGHIVFLKFQKAPTRWIGLAVKGIEVRELPGKHIEILRDPHARLAGEQLSAILERTQATVSKKPPVK